MEKNNTLCPNCKFVFIGHTNLFGKMCTRCDTYIPPVDELSIIKENRMKKEILFKQAIEMIRKRRKNADSQ